MLDRNTTSSPRSQRIAGSFRDPSGYVFRRGEAVYRAVDAECAELLRTLMGDGTLPGLIEQGLIVGTQFVTEPESQWLGAEHGGFSQFLSHTPLTEISYPYEWTVGMLADAAVCTLSVQEALVKRGLALKDASAYNIQFTGGRPVFIDLTSIERPQRLDLWYALGQFQRMFLYPLLLCRYHGWDLRSYFLPNLDGLSLDRVAGAMGRFNRLRPRALLDVTLPLLFSRMAERSESAGRIQGSSSSAAQAGSSPQLMTLKRMRRKVETLAAGYRPTGVWAGYKSTCTYDLQAQDAKKELVRNFLVETRPVRVLDVGCNTGDYSMLAADCSARVVAVDSDHDAVELLYRRLRENRHSVLPLVVDLANPSPAIGFRNEERPSFLSRVRPDCVLALALLHHLLVSANLSLEQVRDLFCDVTSRDLVLEFVPVDDPMFRKLVRFRADLHAELTLDHCRQTFATRFALIREEAIPGTARTLLFLRKTEGP